MRLVIVRLLCGTVSLYLASFGFDAALTCKRATRFNEITRLRPLANFVNLWSDTRSYYCLGGCERAYTNREFLMRSEGAVSRTIQHMQYTCNWLTQAKERR
jgi:hypothetical protein